MKKISLAFIFLAVSALSANAQKKEKRHKIKTAPETTVVELEADKKPIVVEKPAAEYPANGSLYTDNAPNANLVVDLKARRVGDLVFVDVVETSVSNVNSNASRKRDSGDAGGIGTLAGALPISGAAAAQTVIGALGTRKYEGKGTTGRSSSVRARIAARVVEVLPNGDLRIEAIKLVKVNKETEQLAMSGIVRSVDLAADNSIPTTFIGDLRVEMNGKGVASADNAPGWLFRLFDKFNPF